MLRGVVWLIVNWKLALLLVAAGFFGYLGIRSRMLSSALDKAQRKASELEGYRKTRQSMDEVDELVGDDPEAARRYLKERREG